MAVLVFLLLLRCTLPDDPHDPKNTGVTITLRNSEWEQDGAKITDTVGNTVQIGIVLHLPQFIDSAAMNISVEGTSVFDTVFGGFSSATADTIWKKMHFNSSGTKTVTVTPYSSIDLSPIVAVITIIGQPGEGSLDTLNVAPEWDTDTIPVEISDTGSYSLTLTEVCGDSNSDTLEFLLLESEPETDMVDDGVYSITGEESLVGRHTIQIVAIDPHGETDTLILQLTITRSPASGACLTLLRISAGTLTEVSSPVPDTARDTVSFLDSSVTVTAWAKDSMAVVTVEGKEIQNGTASEPIALPVGSTSIPIQVTASDESVDNGYTLIVVRKSATTLKLTTPPTGIAATAVSASAVRVEWDDLFGAYAYSIQRSTREGEGFEALGTVTGNSFTDTGLVEETTYYYRVDASNDSGSSGYSDAVSAATWKKVIITNQPVDTTLVVGSTLALRVTAEGTGIGYRWRRGGVTLSETSATLSFEALTTVDAGSYAVVVSNGSDSAVSEPFRVRVIPVKPAGLRATVLSATAVKIDWEEAAGADEYTVLRAEENGMFIEAGTSSTTVFTDDRLTEGVEYTYRVLAVNSDGISDTGSSVRATTWDGPSLGTLEPVTIAQGLPFSLTVTATGTPPFIYQWKKDGEELDGENGTTLAVASAEPDDAGDYRVVVTNEVGSVNSNPVTVTVIPVYTLSVNRTVAGGGVVVEKDSAVYLSGSAVTLTAMPKTGYRFTGWSGDTTATDNPLTVIMSENRSIIAKYIKQYQLTLVSSDAVMGTVTSPAGSSPVTVDSGVAVAVAAEPASGYVFKQWSSTASGVVFEDDTADTTTVTLSQENASIEGMFGYITFAVQPDLSDYSGANLVDGVQTEDGGYLLVGTMSDATLLVKMDESGAVEWIKSDDGITGARSIHRVSGNSFLVAGVYLNLQPSIVNFAANGERAWEYNLQILEWGARRAMVTKDGGYIVCTGRLSMPIGEFRLVRMSSARVPLWDSSYATGSAADCIPTRDGGFIITGTGGDRGLTAMVVKTDAAGTVVWTRGFSSTLGALSPVFFRAVDTTGDGGVVIAGGGMEGTLDRAFLLKLDTAGDVDKFSFLEDATGIAAIRTTGAGDYLVAGSTVTRSTGGGEDIYIAKIGINGEILDYSSYGATGNETACSLRLTDDGGALVVGTGNRVIKTDPDGKVY
ncbi:MAG: cadherin-like beta sandwich domain-containing protein [Chitinispirillaceae bacterium]|nr:cadherin-like beta sandwich domain-containing protein [Chitinispirillaceae bacterium]